MAGLGALPSAAVAAMPERVPKLAPLPAVEPKLAPGRPPINELGELDVA